MREFRSILGEAIDRGECLALTLSRRRKQAGDGPQKITVRPTIVRGLAAYQFASRHGSRETHENLAASEAQARIADLFPAAYADCHLSTPDADYAARATNNRAIRCRRSPPTKTHAEAAHNRAKNYLIPDGVPCPFLIEMGVMTTAGQVRQAKYSKFRQINRYLELVGDVYDQLPAQGTLNVVDFGCGKSYLTFALHYLLTEIHERGARIVGLDRNPEVIETCRQTAQRIGCAGLEFQVGDIATHRTEEPVHLAVSLHACDTATDDALAQAIRWRADVILAVPCCQHELAGQIESLPLGSLLRHGLFRERTAALATDALRAAALEVCGYRTQVVEFIDMEHTPKNVLLRAVRGEMDEERRSRFRVEYNRLKESLGLKTIYLDEVLGAELAEAAADNEVN